MKSSHANLVALLLCLLFVVLGSLWIWRPGLQSDEALFASGIHPPFYFPEESIRIFGHDFAVMVMSYVGALKGHLWTPIFEIWGTNITTIRFPALLVGALSVWWFYRLLLRALGIRAALIGCGLLATDVMYLLTVRWDWGPVALQHLLLVAGMIGVLRWWQERQLVFLALGFFAFGLAMWDKALFIWSLAGLGVAVLAVFPRETLRCLTWRNVTVAVLAFCLGAFLFIRYNVRHQFVTFRSNTVWTTQGIQQKATLLRDTLNGSALFGFIMRDDWEQPERPPDSSLERLVVGMSEASGSPRRNLQGWLFGIALLLLPVIWKTAARRAVLFALTFIVVTWLQMAFVENAGGGAHHSILLWPMPHLVIAASFGAASGRWRWGCAVATVVVGAGCVSNVLVLSTYYTNLIRNGSVVTWTDAIYPVSDAIKRLQMDFLCVADWGFYDNISAMHDGQVNMCVAEDPVNTQAAKYSLRQIQNPRIYFIAHTRGNEVQPGIAERIEKLAVENGHEKVSAGVFSDANGRAVVELFTFRAKPGS